MSGDPGKAGGKSVQWTDFSRERLIRKDQAGAKTGPGAAGAKTLRGSVLRSERPERKRRAGARRARTIFQWKIVSAERLIRKDRAGVRTGHSRDLPVRLDSTSDPGQRTRKQRSGGPLPGPIAEGRKPAGNGPSANLTPAIRPRLPGRARKRACHGQAGADGFDACQIRQGKGAAPGSLNPQRTPAPRTRKVSGNAAVIPDRAIGLRASAAPPGGSRWCRSRPSAGRQSAGTIPARLDHRWRQHRTAAPSSS